jgi:hypothetical protein
MLESERGSRASDTPRLFQQFLAKLVALVEFLVACGGRRLALIVYCLTFNSAVSPFICGELRLVGQRIIRSVGTANCSKGKENQ